MGRRASAGGRVHVGCSGWVYPDWVPGFYPPGLPQSRWLTHYASRFDTVEINATFYKLASEAAVAHWSEAVPPGFHWVAKGSQLITHRLKLAECEGAIERFFAPLRRLRGLEVVLWQLPQRFPKDLERIDAFLGALPKGVRHALEARDPWFWDDATASVLARHSVAFVSVSHPALPSDVVATTDFLYVRFHGIGESLYNYHYSDAELRTWAARIKAELPGRSAYVFFNNDYHANATNNARTLRRMLEHGGSSVAAADRAMTARAR